MEPVSVHLSKNVLEMKKMGLSLFSSSGEHKEQHLQSPYAETHKEPLRAGQLLGREGSPTNWGVCKSCRELQGGLFGDAGAFESSVLLKYPLTTFL